MVIIRHLSISSRKRTSTRTRTITNMRISISKIKSTSISMSIMLSISSSISVSIITSIIKRISLSPDATRSQTIYLQILCCLLYGAETAPSALLRC